MKAEAGGQRTAATSLRHEISKPFTVTGRRRTHPCRNIASLESTGSAEAELVTICAERLPDTYVPQGRETAGRLQEAESNIRAEVGPWRDLRSLLEDADKLSKDERDEEVDDSSHDHNQEA